MKSKPAISSVTCNKCGKSFPSFTILNEHKKQCEKVGNMNKERRRELERKRNIRIATKEELKELWFSKVEE